MHNIVLLFGASIFVNLHHKLSTSKTRQGKMAPYPLSARALSGPSGDCSCSVMLLVLMLALLALLLQETMQPLPPSLAGMLFSPSTFHGPCPAGCHPLYCACSLSG
jgi:hypothetical protein